MWRAPGRKRLPRRSRREEWLRSIVWGALITALIIAVWWGLTRPVFLISAIEISGNKVIAADDLQNQITESLAGNQWLVVPKRSIFFYSQKNLTAEVLSAFPRIQKVDLALTREGQLQVAVTEREAVMLACRAAVEKKDCWFVDNTGQLFNPAPLFSDHVYFEFYEPLPSAPLGQQLMPNFNNFYRFWLGANKVLANDLGKDTTIYRGELGEAGDIKLMVNDWQIIINQSQSAADLINNLDSVLGSDELKGKTGQLDYLDLRLGRKVFYKFK